MEVLRKELIVVGAGPAGLSAAIEAAKCGVKATVFDENAAPGGQLFKQIHKFFGSKEHKAKIRGFRIGQELLKEAEICLPDEEKLSLVITIDLNNLRQFWSEGLLFIEKLFIYDSQFIFVCIFAHIINFVFYLILIIFWVLFLMLF